MTLLSVCKFQSGSRQKAIKKDVKQNAKRRKIATFASKIVVMKHVLSILVLSTLGVVTLQAQQTRPTHRTDRADNATTLLRSYEDSLSVLYNKVYRQNDKSALSRDFVENIVPYQSFRLFSPLTFYEGIARDLFYLSGDSTINKAQNQRADYLAPRFTDKALLGIYLKRPDLVLNRETVLHNVAPESKTTPVVIRSDAGLAEKESQTPIEPENGPINVVVTKPNFWTFKGDYYLQFLQNYVSGNWHKGGESNYSMVSAVTIQCNYNNKQKVKFDNKLEMKLGFITSPSDTLHSLKTSEDLIRFTSKLGLQATKRWYYTLQLVAYTQFMRGYKNNSGEAASDFMSPFNANLSLGMDYNVDWIKGRLKGSIHLAPLAYNFRYVDRLSVAPRYGLSPDSHTLHDFGSEFTVDLMWKIAEPISWQTRLYGYTTYRRAEVEWENTFTFQFNKFISSKLFVYPRFDDGAARDEKHGYLQMREFVSIGFSYSF